MSLEKEILLLLKKKLKANKFKIDLDNKIIVPESRLLEWDEVEEKFYEINQPLSTKSRLLINIDKQKKDLLKNTRQFCKGLPSNNALLWGARGTGKSSLVYSIFLDTLKDYKVSMIEVKNFQIKSLNKIVRTICNEHRKFIIFCDDIAFNLNDENFLHFKSILDGTLRKVSNVIFYATSNYRHMVKNDKLSKENRIVEQENMESITALSDRFGLWLGFPSFNKATFLKIVNYYKNVYKLKIDNTRLEKKALEWSTLRGSNSGREAENFIKYMINAN